MPANQTNPVGFSKELYLFVGIPFTNDIHINLLKLILRKPYMIFTILTNQLTDN